MNWLAGAMAYAEAVSAAIAQYHAAGGGAQGWAAATTHLAQTFVGAAATSIRSIIRYAQATVSVGTQYASGGPNYAPPRNSLPDVRPIESYAGIGPNGPNVYTNTASVRHEAFIEIINPDGSGVWYSTYATFESSGVLTRAELEARAAQEVGGMLRALDTVPAASGRDHIDFEVRVRFRGAWIGYE